MQLGKTEIDDIYLKDIDWENNFFHISTVGLPPGMLDSIYTIGMINQPFVILKQEKYVIVSGFRRLSACRHLHVDHISVKILDPQTSVLDCATLAIADNSLQRSLNLMEQSRSYTLLESVYESNDALKKNLATIGLSDNPSWINKTKPLSNLPLPIQSAIEKDAISLATAQALSEMDEDLAIFLTALFQDLTLGLNKQREIIKLAFEISKRRRFSLKKIFYGKDLQIIIENPHLDKNEKAARIRQWLKEERYPSLSREQKKFDRRKRALKLGNRVKLIPPPYFEGKSFTLSLAFSTKEELSKLKRIIHRLEEDEYLISFLH